MIKLSDFIADTLVQYGIDTCFTVVGGGAMHLNDSFGHHPGLHCYYLHHEQACAIAAEAYARVTGKPALLCVTTGPGGTNALTGVLGAWLDSIPMIVISGQVRLDTTTRYNEQYTDGFPLRSVGDQEFDITKTVRTMTKYAAMVEKPEQIAQELETAYTLATTGRPGPCWLDIPLDIQAAQINPASLNKTAYSPELPPLPTAECIESVLKRIKQAQRPVFYPGNGVRLAHAMPHFLSVAEKLHLPIVTSWDSIDLIPTDHPLYVGRAGNMGDRPGNFAVQNADLLLVVGNRLSIRNTGYTFDTWARAAHVIMVDVDQGELKKPHIHVETPVWADAKAFLERLDAALSDTILPSFEAWNQRCQNWKRTYPVVQDKHRVPGPLNVYNAFDQISRRLPSGSVTAVSNGSCCVAGHQSWVIQEGSRFLNNNATASMGYGLPAAIGACIANGHQDVLCLEGDGSIMMNLQELQSILTYQLPIKIFLVNNNGYHSIRQTQRNFFSHHTPVGIGPESNDLSFPSYREIAQAFGYPYSSIHTNEELSDKLDSIMSQKGPLFVELFVSTEQAFEPKNTARQLADGSIVSAPLEDLAPFLSREELAQNMCIPLVDDFNE